MKKNSIILALVLTAVLAAASAAARHGGPPADGERGPRAEFISNLSEEQRTAMREIMEAHRDEMESLRAELEAESEELRELVKSEAGETAIFAKVDEIGALRTEMMKKRIEMQLQIRAQLTDEQKEQLDERPMMGMGSGRPGGGRGPGGPGGPGGFGPGGGSE